MKSIRHSLGFVIAVFSIAVIAHSCEKEMPDNKEIMAIDTLDYTEVIRTTDNFFGVSDLYFNEGTYSSFIDTCMNITTNRVIFFTGPEVDKTVTIQIKVQIPVPYNFTVVNHIVATGECVISADKGHYLFKGGNYSEITSSEGDKIIVDTMKMNKIITGQTIRISPIYLDSNDNSYLYLETNEILYGNFRTREDYYDPIDRAIDLFKENAISFSMKVKDNNIQERDIASCSEIDYNNDYQIIIEASYRANFTNPAGPFGVDTRTSVWKKPGDPMMLIIGE